MIILRETAEAQTINIIPTRGDEATRMVITDETTKQSQEFDFCFTTEEYYLSFTDVLELKEDHFYTLRVYNEDKLVHIDRIFCTNQEPDVYSVNNAEYTEKENTIIFYE